MLKGIFRRGKHWYGREELFLAIGIVISTALFFITIYLPSFQSWSQHIWDVAFRFSQDHGYFGGAVAAFFAHASVLVPVPYTLVLLYLGSVGLNVLMLGLIAGLGAGLGEVTSYLTGVLGGAVVWKKYHTHFLALRSLLDSRPRVVPWIIFLFGISPLPDDVLLIPLGMVRYNFFRMFIPMLIGKVVMTTAISALGLWLAPTINSLAYQSDTPWASFVTLVLVVVGIYIVIKIDWQGLSQRLLRQTPAAGVELDRPSAKP